MFCVVISSTYTSDDHVSVSLYLGNSLNVAKAGLELMTFISSEAGETTILNTLQCSNFLSPAWNSVGGRPFLLLSLTATHRSQVSLGTSR